MAATGRVGTGLLGISGLALAGLMAYTLAYDGCASREVPGSVPSVVADVAVFFPDRREWSHFRQAVEACAKRGLARPADEVDGSIVVETPRRGRRVRFRWQGTRGVRETRDGVERLAGLPRPPVAVVGSSTTALTAAMAEALGRGKPGGPVLLVPWATAVRAEGGVLLEINRGRTFRFCPNDQRLAESVVDCLIEQDHGKLPGLAFLVVDPLDPYSVDLADSFRRAIQARAPSAQLVERSDTMGLPTAPSAPKAVLTPSPADEILADAIWAAIADAPDDRPSWVVLPLQGEPSRRMIAALQSRLGGRKDGPLRVVCGDAVGREALEGLQGPRSLPIWCASISSIAPPGLGVTDDSHAFAEIVSSILLAVEQSPHDEPTPDDVRDFLAGLDLPKEDPSAFGRPLWFGPDGERRDAPGSVLAIRPGLPAVIGFALGDDGRWRPVDPDDPGPPEAGR